MSGYLIALDLGTTSCRALVFDGEGRVAGHHGVAYPLHTPELGWAEQDPAVLVAAAERAVEGALAQAGARSGSVLGISLSTYLHSFVALDEDGEPLTPIWTWADSRAADQAEAVRQRAEWRSLYHRTGCPPHPMYPLYKLIWLREAQPDLLARAAWFGGIKELLLQRWTGRFLVDESVASGTGLFDLRRGCWDEGALRLAGIHAERLAPVVPVRTALPLAAEAASRLGLLPGTPVVVGAGDGVLSNLGAGATAPGIFAAMVGTSGALRTCVAEPVADPQARVWCYHLDERSWVVGGAISNGGMVLRWVRDRLYTPTTPYDEIIAEAAAVAPGADALLFLPYLSGERSPGFDARARGVWFGLGLEHTRAHMARSALEAVAYRLYSVLGPLEELAGSAQEIRATGGLAQSDLWLQICADAWGREVIVPAQTEGSALGAYLLGAAALGVKVAPVPAPGAAVRRFTPNGSHHARYRELFALYSTLRDKVSAEYQALARFRESLC